MILFSCLEVVELADTFSLWSLYRKFETKFEQLPNAKNFHTWNELQIFDLSLTMTEQTSAGRDDEV